MPRAFLDAADIPPPHATLSLDALDRWEQEWAEIEQWSEAARMDAAIAAYEAQEAAPCS